MSKPVHARVHRTFMVLSGAVLAMLASMFFFSGGVGAADTPSNSHVVNGGCSNYLPSGSVVAMAASPAGNGYWIANSAGQVVNCGSVIRLPSLGPINLPIVGMASTPDGHGAWLVAADGGVFALGTRVFTDRRVLST